MWKVFRRVYDELFRPVDIASLAFFRVVFGLSMLFFAFFYYKQIMIDILSMPGVHMSFYGFSWVKQVPGVPLAWEVWVLRVAALFITLGCLYRCSMGIFLLLHLHLTLLDATRYQNHLYLIFLLSLLLLFMPAHRAWSIDALVLPRLYTEYIPKWPVYLLRMQLGVVYFYAGAAKLNGDWVRGEPMRTLLTSGGFPAYMREEWFVYLFSWMGMCFDLLIVPLLLWPRTRLAAFVLCIFFHLMNAQLWHIDVFPYLMMGATTIFFVPEWPRLVLAHVRKVPFAAGAPPRHTAGGRWQPAVAGAVLLFAAIQVLAPLRPFLYPGNALWTDVGRHYCWRMMLVRKQGVLSFTAKNPASGETVEIDPRTLPLAGRISAGFLSQPEYILQLAHLSAAVMRANGWEEVEVYATAYASMHRRRPQQLIDPEVNLARVRRDPWPAAWVLPLQEPLLYSQEEREAAAALWEEIGGAPREW